MDENRYLDILQSEDPKRREQRAKRRKAARTRAFVILVVIIVLAVGVIGGSVYFLLKGKIKLPQIAVIPTKVSIETIDPAEQEVKNAITDLVGSEEDVVVITPVVESEPPKGEDLYDEWLAGEISKLSLEDKVMGLFIVAPESITGVDACVQAGDGTKKALEQYHVGGLLYSEKNITSKDQFTTMLTKTREYVLYPTFYMMKEEPGFGSLSKFTVATKNAGEIAATMDPYTASTENETVAGYLAEAGVNFNLGLVADPILTTDGSGFFLQGHSYGSDSTVVSRMVAESVGSYTKKNVSIAIGKFPGEGALTQDPSQGVVNNEITKENLDIQVVPIYTAAIENGANAIIVSHQYADNLTTDNLPCSLSKEIYTDILRNELHLNRTILITDDLSQPAIANYYTAGEACIKAFKAGADMVMCPDDPESALTEVVEAVKSGIISEERINDSLKRVWWVKFIDRLPEFDAQAATMGEPADGQ